jgi:hypothetical protein
VGIFPPEAFGGVDLRQTVEIASFQPLALEAELLPRLLDSHHLKDPVK